MNFDMIPAPKRAKAFGGEFCFDALRIFTVGEGESFRRTLHALLPEIKSEETCREDANVILTVASVFSGKSEYCAIRIQPDRMEIRCRDGEGARNAAAILAQLLINNGTRERLPCGSLEDWPDASYRAMMLENSGRVWMPMKEIYAHLRRMALARMNTLQFHFMESPGCTIQLDCFPHWHGYGPDNLRFTKDEVRQMIAYAAELGIHVCPFIEVISHATAFTEAAEIACPGDQPERCFAVCVGQEKTFEAIEKVLAEVAALFPDPVIHIGGDEYDMSAVSPRTVHWGECPHCQALSAKMGFTTYRGLFIYAVERVNQMVNRLGKIAMLWNADLKPGEIPDTLERNIIIHYYRRDNPLCSEKIFGLSIDGYVEDGFSVLNSDYNSTYLDAYVRPERLAGWGYDSDPKVKESNRAGVIGGCCCAWEEHPHFALTIPPAIFLFGDRLWNSFGDPTLYDEKFARLLTKILFEGKLPEGTNIFEAAGDILPPVKKTEHPFHANNLFASPERLEALQKNLAALEGDPLAEAYAKLAGQAAAYRRERLAAAPRTETIQFEG